MEGHGGGIMESAHIFLFSKWSIDIQLSRICHTKSPSIYLRDLLSCLILAIYNKPHELRFSFTFTTLLHPPSHFSPSLFFTAFSDWMANTHFFVWTRHGASWMAQGKVQLRSKHTNDLTIHICIFRSIHQFCLRDGHQHGVWVYFLPFFRFHFCGTYKRNKRVVWWIGISLSSRGRGLDRAGGGFLFFSCVRKVGMDWGGFLDIRKESWKDWICITLVTAWAFFACLPACLVFCGLEEASGNWRDLSLVGRKQCYNVWDFKMRCSCLDLVICFSLALSLGFQVRQSHVKDLSYHKSCCVRFEQFLNQQTNIVSPHRAATILPSVHYEYGLPSFG